MLDRWDLTRRFSRFASMLAALLTASFATGATAARAPQPGELRFVSPTGQTLGTMRGQQAGDAFGMAWDAQAVRGTDGGGAMVGAPGTDGGGRTYVFDLGDLSLFRIIDAATLGGGLARFGESVLQIGHINGDLGVHWAVGAPGDPGDADAAGAVVILHQLGFEFAERTRVDGPVDGSLFGWRLAVIDHDFTDSINDHFAVGAPREAKGAKQNVGSVSMYDSVTGALVWKTQGSKAHEYFGYSLRPVPDVDGDGVADVIVGAPGRSNRKPAGRVVFLSGATGKPIRQLEAPREASLFGFDIASWPLTGDLIVGAPASEVAGIEGAGIAYLYPGDGSAPILIEGSDVDGWLGLDVGLTDIHLDGEVDAVVADLWRAARANKDNRGRVAVFTVATWDLLDTFQGKRGGDYFGLGGFTLHSDFGDDGIFDYVASVPRAPLSFVPE